MVVVVVVLVGGGGTQPFWSRYVLCWFPKVGSREQIFFEKSGVLGVKI